MITPRNTLKTIVGVNIALFVVCLLLSLPTMQWSLSPFSALSPTTDVLNFMGASGIIPIDGYQAWWSLLTANWLHGSLLHIVFNMMALRTVGAMAIAEYGVARMFSIYSLSGALGFYLSYLGGVYLTIGASAGLCGLIGAQLYFGYSSGGPLGQYVLRQTWGWIMSLALMGFIIPNINNWGHGGGFVGGFVLAWCLKHNGQRRETRMEKALAVTLALVTLYFLCRPLIHALVLTLM